MSVTDQVPTLEEEEALISQVEFILSLARAGGTVKPDLYPLIQKYLPQVFLQAEKLAIRAQIDQLEEEAGLVGSDLIALGRIAAEIEKLEDEAAALVNEALAHVKPIDLELINELDPKVFKDLQIAISLGNADSITPENFPTNQLPISYLRFQLAALEAAKDSWKAKKLSFDELDGSELGLIPSSDEEEISYKIAKRFSQINVEMALNAQAYLILKFIEDNPEFSNDPDLLELLAKLA